MLVSWRSQPHNSLIEKFDPRARWIFSLSFMLAATMFWDARFLAGFFGLGLGWYLLAGVPWRETRRGWTLVGIMLVMMIVVNTILTGGGAGGVVPPGGRLVWPDGLALGGWTLHWGLTYERLWFALCQVLRIGGISAVFLILPFTLDPRMYGVTFHGLGLPDKFAYSLELAFRYVPTIGRDFSATIDAQRARGYELERVDGNLIKQILRVAPLIVPVTMNSILTGEDVVNAMDLRCFGQRPRTWLYALKYRWFDYALIAFSLLLMLVSFILASLKIGGFWFPPFF